MTEKERHHQWYLDNRDRIRAMHREYDRIHKEEKRARQRQRYVEKKSELLAKNRAWRIKNKDRFTELNVKNHLKRKYGITIERYNEMVVNQNGMCEICRKTPEQIKRKLDVDHNHSNGKVRALLCPRCNCALGHVNDDIELLQKMIDYIKKYNQ